MKNPVYLGHLNIRQIEMVIKPLWYYTVLVAELMIALKSYLQKWLRNWNFLHQNRPTDDWEQTWLIIEVFNILSNYYDSDVDPKLIGFSIIRQLQYWQTVFETFEPEISLRLKEISIPCSSC